MASLEKTDASYLKNHATLKQLEREEDRRNGKLTTQEAMTVVQDRTSTASELRRAKTSITQARDNVDTSDTAQIKAYNDALATIENAWRRFPVRLRRLLWILLNSSRF